MLRIVQAIISPEVTGAIFPGNDNAQTTFSPSFPAVSKSTPPGFEARSIIRASFFIWFRHFSFSITAGTVLKIKSYSPIIFSRADV